jgi:ABC-type nitrate/sulfonate/bicarbonate transport system permease component
MSANPAPTSEPAEPRPRFTLNPRAEVPLWQSILLGVLCVGFIFGLWYLATEGEGDQRWIERTKLPSPGEVFGRLPYLVSERGLDVNTFASLWRVIKGFSLAILIGVPLGLLCGCFPRLYAFFLPVSLFGRNIPMAAVIPLMLLFFGTSETGKMMFIFVAAVAFVMDDAARAVRDVNPAYIDTAYTLGASTTQVIFKVLIPLAMPNIFNSMRLLFGLAFGYIMLAEYYKGADEIGGLGYLLENSLRRSLYADLYLILLLIPALALVIDLLLYFVQVELFPYRHGSVGYLNHLLTGIGQLGENVVARVIPRRPPPGGKR